jgi:DMSO/TMAO reductase YedYZ molybdopterin-dependent catalytic subunit
MKLDRRAFIRLIPIVAVAVASGSWWLLGHTAEKPTMTSQATMTTSVASQATATTSEAFPFPVTGEQSTKVNSNDYRLKIDGDVSKPLELTLEELYAMSDVQRTLRIVCVEGWAADVPWEGVTLSRLLSQAGASLKNIASARVETIRGGYSTTVRSDEIANPNCMIALKAGGAPLTVEHGYPARLVLPPRLGIDWVKYVARITCTNK